MAAPPKGSRTTQGRRQTSSHGRGHDGKRDASQSSPKQPPGSWLALLAAVTMNRPVPAFSRVPGVGHFLSPPRLDAPRLSDPWRSALRALAALTRRALDDLLGQLLRPGGEWASGKPSVAIVQTGGGCGRPERGHGILRFPSSHRSDRHACCSRSAISASGLHRLCRTARSSQDCLPPAPPPGRRSTEAASQAGARRNAPRSCGRVPTPEAGSASPRMFKPLQYHPSARRVKAKRRGSRLSLWV